MPDSLNISQYDLLSPEDVDLSQDLVLLNNDESSTFSSTAQDLLNKSTVKNQERYFVKSTDLNIDSRSLSIDISSGLDLENLLDTNSEFTCKVNFICDFDKTGGEASGMLGYKMLKLPSFLIRKNIGSTELIFENYKSFSRAEIGSSSSEILSSIYYNNSAYNIRSFISSGVDFIRFDNICYSTKESFKTKINFIYTSLI